MLQDRGVGRRAGWSQVVLNGFWQGEPMGVAASTVGDVAATAAGTGGVAHLRDHPVAQTENTMTISQVSTIWNNMRTTFLL